MTDAHVHLRDWQQSEKETILHGLKLASDLGYKHIFDMPNTKPAITTQALVKKRLEDALCVEKILKLQNKEIYYHLYCGLTDDEDQIKDMVDSYNLFPRVCALKLFASQSTGNMGLIGKEKQLKVYKTLKALDYKGLIAVHCEKEDLFNKNALKHSEIRPSISEVQSVDDQIECVISSGFEGTLHIAHISTEGALKLVREARKSKIKITCASTSHHSLLNKDSESMLLKMNPPLREESDRKAIWEALFDNTIDWVESDHAPHTLFDKENGASGIPGFEGSLILINALRNAKMDEKHLKELFCTNALKAFGISESDDNVPIISKKMLNLAHNAYPFSAWL